MPDALSTMLLKSSRSGTDILCGSEDIRAGSKVPLPESANVLLTDWNLRGFLQHLYWGPERADTADTYDT